MTVRELELSEVPRVATDLFANHHIVAIVPECGDSDWAVGAAWSIARAAAATGRRTALVDLNLESPSLHERSKDARDIGIVDAFQFGASLQHVASRENDPNLHFIGVGTPPQRPDEVWASDRWQRLSRGFVREQAILLVFLPADALDHLALKPDLFFAVSPRGFGSAGPQSLQIRSVIDRGVPVAVVTDTHAPPVESRTTDSEDGDTPTRELAATNHRRPGRAWLILISLLSVVVTATVAVSVMMLSGRGAVQTADEPVTDTAPSSATAADTPRAEAVRLTGPDSVQIPEAAEEPPGLPVLPPGSDSLHLSIQVSAWRQLSQARDHLSRFYAAGFPATITAVRRDSALVWYRVVVGTLHDFGAASRLRQSLRADGLIGPTVGVLLRTPLALLLETHADSSSGWQAARGLRESGIPAYIVSMPDGSVQVLLGAFESPDQAELTDSVFPGAGHDLSRDLVLRVGIAR